MALATSLWRQSILASGDSDPCALFGLSGAGTDTVENLFDRCPLPARWIWVDEARRVLDKSERQGIMMIAFGTDSYPTLLERLPDPPLVLMVRGTLPEMPGIAMVGTRRPTVRTRRAFEELASGLARFRFPIVSGLAAGLDGAAHRGAVAGGGTTVAVVGTGLDRVYPSFHAGLEKTILDNGGAIVSEYPPGTGPEGWHFPFRNRLIVGLSAGLVAGPHRRASGTGITVRRALEEGREVVVFLEGADRLTDEGPKFLIEQGAIKVSRPEEIILAIGTR
jgi:DNA processing protein